MHQIDEKGMLVMKNIFLIVSIIFICAVSLFLSSFIVPNWSIAGSVDLRFNNETMTASLEDASLSEIFKRISEEKNIRVNGKNSVLEKRVSVQFINLSFQDGLKRILSKMDYCVTFDNCDKITGVIIIGEKRPDPHMSESRVGRANIIGPLKNRNYQEHVHRPLMQIDNISPSSVPNKATDQELVSPKIVTNPFRPDGPIKQRPKIVDNPFPPDGPVTISPKAFESLKVVKNCQPPGGPVKATVEQP